MMIASLLEANHETRVAITPNSAKQYLKLGFQVAIEKNAGTASGYTDAQYQQLGVQILESNDLEQIDILLCVNQPNPKELTHLRKDTLIAGHIENDPQSSFIQWAMKQHISLFSMNLIPRLSRAQSMDSLSSQANLAGYRAVIEAIHAFNRAVPMMMTAAGMIQPAKVLVLGAGVAGLQAIATAKRLGAVVYAFDVRQAAKEQVESLGAQFIVINQEQDAQTKEGYAGQSSEEYKQLQAQSIDHYAKLSDIIISTALIPNHKAPILLYQHTVEQMKPGSVIVDLAVLRGGNCEVSVLNKTIQYGDITVIGLGNIEGLIPATASDLYANNLLHLIQHLSTKPLAIEFNPEDEIIQQAVLCQGGNYLPFRAIKETQ